MAFAFPPALRSAVRRGAWILAAVALAACPRESAPPSRVIIPGVRAGPVTAETSEADLIRQLGAAHVRRADLGIGEGETRPGTILFPGGADELLVFWKEDAFRSPEHVVVRGGATNWTTAEGIRLGTTLDTLARLNGRPFQLLGFDWDYAGTVVSWENGRLAPMHGRLVIRLAPTAPATGLSAADHASVAGDHVISSDMPALPPLHVTIYEMAASF